MSFFKWSKTANNNANADGTINWAEGQAPSTVNNSARAMMAAAAKYRDDIAGVTTGGTATAYTVASNQAFDSLVSMDGKLIALVPHVTSGAGPVTLNVDGLGAKALRSAPGVELAAGTLISGTPYVARYVNSASEWILCSFFGANPYNVPLGAGMPYFLPAAPNSSFAFPSGQPISRTTYAALFALMGTTYGAGDGATTFNLPKSWRPAAGLPREHERSGRGGAHHVRWIRHCGHDAGRNRRGAERRARRRRNSIARACQRLERPRPRAWCERPDAFARGERPDPRA